MSCFVRAFCDCSWWCSEFAKLADGRCRCNVCWCGTLSKSYASPMGQGRSTNQVFKSWQATPCMRRRGNLVVQPSLAVALSPTTWSVVRVCFHAVLYCLPWQKLMHLSAPRLLKLLQITSDIYFNYITAHFISPLSTV
ncbi:hypothetical protein JZ751_001071 [Albula glossodonta]|uniref:Uncharacterized protein n=1 Tax=Albula glossodonta TaxID=121402 RepID=A0A8T2PSP3_9TELE|nr:hypothetical protein JZ751_001071 [Albula glossodonta]